MLTATIIEITAQITRVLFWFFLPKIILIFILAYFSIFVKIK